MKKVELKTMTTAAAVFFDNFDERNDMKRKQVINLHPVTIARIHYCAATFCTHGSEPSSVPSHDCSLSWNARIIVINGLHVSCMGYSRCQLVIHISWVRAIDFYYFPSLYSGCRALCGTVRRQWFAWSYETGGERERERRRKSCTTQNIHS